MMRAAFLSVVLFTAACTPPASDEPAPEPVAETPAAAAEDTCGAAQYRSLIGANFAAVTLPANQPNLRIIQPGVPHTDDLRRDRANIIVDENGIITSVECY